MIQHLNTSIRDDKGKAVNANSKTEGPQNGKRSTKGFGSILKSLQQGLSKKNESQSESSQRVVQLKDESDIGNKVKSGDEKNVRAVAPESSAGGSDKSDKKSPNSSTTETGNGKISKGSQQKPVPDGSADLTPNSTEKMGTADGSNNASGDTIGVEVNKGTSGATKAGGQEGDALLKQNMASDSESSKQNAAQKEKVNFAGEGSVKPGLSEQKGEPMESSREPVPAAKSKGPESTESAQKGDSSRNFRAEHSGSTETSSSKMTSERPAVSTESQPAATDGREDSTVKKQRTDHVRVASGVGNDSKVTSETPVSSNGKQPVENRFEPAARSVEKNSTPGMSESKVAVNSRGFSAVDNTLKGEQSSSPQVTETQHQNSLANEGKLQTDQKSTGSERPGNAAEQRLFSRGRSEIEKSSAQFSGSRLRPDRSELVRNLSLSSNGTIAAARSNQAETVENTVQDEIRIHLGKEIAANQTSSSLIGNSILVEKVMKNQLRSRKYGEHVLNFANRGEKAVGESQGIRQRQTEPALNTFSPFSKSPFSLSGTQFSLESKLSDDLGSWQELTMDSPSSNENKPSEQQVGGFSRLAEIPVLNFAIRRNVMPNLVQTVQKTLSGQQTSPETWQKHNFTLEEGKNLQVSVRQADGVVYLKLNSSYGELNRLLQQHQNELRDYLEQECNVKVDLQFEGGQDENLSRFFGESRGSKTGSRGKPTLNSAESSTNAETEKVTTTIRKFGYNRMEWMA